LAEISNRLGIKDFAAQVAPRWLLDRIPTDEGDVRRESKTSNIDWESTTVLASGQGPIYIDSSENKYDEIREEIIEKLSSLSGPTGQPIADNVYRGETVYHGPYAQEAPDIVIDQRNGVHISGGLGRDQVFTNPEADGWKGENKRDGLFVATGPDITTGAVGEISILDLAPSILHLHGCALPHDLDGTVQKTIFAEDSGANDRQVEYRSQSDNMMNDGEVKSEKKEGLRDRLEDLGYLE
jgi:predicted AlkP superfamily phosphohydrolase/phosphomutase